MHSNPVDEMVHPADIGNKKIPMGDVAGQAYNDPTSNKPGRLPELEGRLRT